MNNHIFVITVAKKRFSYIFFIFGLGGGAVAPTDSLDTPLLRGVSWLHSENEDLAEWWLATGDVQPGSCPPQPESRGLGITLKATNITQENRLFPLFPNSDSFVSVDFTISPR